MESSRDEDYSDYHWYWKANYDHDALNQEDEWAPYDLAISNKIEENYIKRLLQFEVIIANETYCFDLKNRLQILKKDTFKRRFITRASKKDKIRVLRKNRFCAVIDSTNSQNNIIASQGYYKNVQVKINISDLFKTNEDPFMLDPSNPIFTTSICISESIYTELKSRFLGKVSFKNLADLMIYLKSEIVEEAKRLSKQQTDTLSDNNFLAHAEIYIKLLDRKKPALTLEEKMLQLYTAEGYLVYSINSVLRNSSLLKSKLPLYFILLQASVGIVSKKYNHLFLCKCLKKMNEELYYVFYRGVQIPETIIREYARKLKDKTAVFQVYNEFLSTTYDLDIAEKFAFNSDLKTGNVPVLYRMLIKKETMESIPNLLCFIEDISQHSQEKEALLSSSTIFQIMALQKKKNNSGDFFVITSSFISNGYNKFDFLLYTNSQKIDLMTDVLSYTNLRNIDLMNEVIGESEVKVIGEAIRINKSMKKLYMYKKRIGAVGAKIIASSIQDNSSLKLINLTKNQIGDIGIKSLAQALKYNLSLQIIYLAGNEIGDDGAIAIAETLKSNTTLQAIDLTENLLGAEGAKVIFEALKNNSSMKEIWLFKNQIGDEGARGVGDLLKQNDFLISLNLMENQIGDEGAISIGEGLSYNNSIRRIWLNNNQISLEVDMDLKKKYQDRVCIRDCLNLENSLMT